MWIRLGLPALALFLLWVAYHEVPLIFSAFMFSWVLFYILGPVVDWLESISIRRGVGSLLALAGLLLVSCLFWARFMVVMVELKNKIDLDYFQESIVERVYQPLVWAGEQWPLARKYLEPPPEPPVPEPPPKMTSGKTSKIAPAVPPKPPPKPKTLRERLSDYVDKHVEAKALELVVALIKVAPRFFFTVLLTLYFTFFLLKDGRKLKKAVIEWIPNRYFEPALKFFYEMDRRLRSYLLSMMVDCTLVGIFVGITTWIAGAPYPIAFGLISGVLNTIPLLGPFFYIVICLILTAGAAVPNEVLLAVLVIVLASRLCDDFIFQPLIYGKSHHLHPGLIITTVLLGEHFAGIWGMLLAVPITSIVFLAISIGREISEGEEIKPMPKSVYSPLA